MSNDHGDLDHTREVMLEPLGSGATKPRGILVRYVAKSDIRDESAKRRFPYQVANEYIGSELGRTIGLPVPACVLHRAADGLVYFCSHWIEQVAHSAAGKPAAPAPPQRTWELLASPRQARLVHGIFVFDLLVANNDRNDGNLLVDRTGGLAVIDFGNCLMYRPRRRRRGGESVPFGVDRLRAVEADLTALWDFEEGYRLQSILTDPAHVEHWCRQIATLPDYIIGAAVDRVPDDCLLPTEKAEVTGFLCRRKAMLFELAVRTLELPEFRGEER